jgi:hypothetical protein
MKKRIITLVVGLAMLAAVAGASADLVHSFATVFAPDAPAIACNNGSHSGGGC